jgi:3-oxoacyl-[acyl-carrier protein] reductase
MNILVTGGSRGIGRAIVKRFSSEGHSVAFIYNRSDAQANALRDECGAIPIKADVGTPEGAITAARKAAEMLGGIDVLVNNAGISEIKLFTDITNEDWEKMLSVNLSGVFYVTREAVKGMVSRKYGRVINIGSMWGKTGASCEVHYSATKAGVRGMTIALAKELGPSGITVNCIEPGVIETDMNACLDKETLKSLENETPLCRIGKPSDVASLSYFLASDEASFITGQVIGVDGGFAV